MATKKTNINYAGKKLQSYFSDASVWKHINEKQKITISITWRSMSTKLAIFNQMD